MTPFADRAVDRALTGVLASLVRNLKPSRPDPIPGQDRPSRTSPRREGVPAARSGASATRLPALLAALCERLTEDRCVALEHTLQAATGPDDARVGRFVADEAAAGLARQLRDIVRTWRAEAPGLTGAGLALALATARSLPRPEPAQVVVSGPLGASVPARLTSGAAVEVIRSATAFLGSANLTDRALSDNIELGVPMRDPKPVNPLVDHFRWLLAPENDLMRRA
ncbi:hypothetical protein ABZY20_15250 [Streptomyces sp. NPDC006624]|uniref:hypothetical protein n=1 Tax=Streptomyces sp. NPDC006624 TaxID=3154892 RepID=UPI00339DCF75